MANEIKAPTFPESVQDGTVATWHKQAGDTVTRDELLVEIETDKVVLEVVAPADGVLADVLKAEGETVLSNELLASIAPAGSAVSAPAASAAAPAASAPSGAALDIKAPTFPESVQDGTVATWHKKSGEAVARDELIVEIETDKVVLEVVAPADGAMGTIVKAEGDTVQSGEVIATIIEGAAGGASAPAADSGQSSANASGDAVASPSARKLAAEKGVDLATVAGSGKNGLITKDDVVNAKPSTAPSAPAKAPVSAPTAAPLE